MDNRESVTRKFLEVSRCRRTKQRQRNTQKKCATHAKLLLLLFFFCSLNLLFFLFFLFFFLAVFVAVTTHCLREKPWGRGGSPAWLALHDIIFCFSKLYTLTRASLLALAKSIY